MARARTPHLPTHARQQCGAKPQANCPKKMKDCIEKYNNHSIYIQNKYRYLYS
jgi:hypothetical protein